jgi:HAE1 family hydrophobic/amphiphilic exporter-1
MISTAAYESMMVSFVILLSVPFALVGIFSVFPVTGLPFGRGGVVAALLLIGIVAANAIVLVDRLRPPGPGLSLTYSQIIDGAQERLRPILLTAGATFAGVVPLLITEPWSSPGFSLAVGLGAGLVSGTGFTLIILPVAVSFLSRSAPQA